MGACIFATPSKSTDYFVLDRPVADISIGTDNTFQIQTPTKVEPRSLVGVYGKFPGNTGVEGNAYIGYGSPWGGIVDEVSKSSDSPDYTLKGRTWPGVLSDFIVIPPDGKTNLTVSDTLGSCVYHVLEAAGWPFDYSWYGGESIKLPYTDIPRFATAKDAIDKLVDISNTGAYEITTTKGDSSMTLNPSFRVMALTPVDIAANMDGVQVTRTETTPAVNHLIGLGAGEGTARKICHRYIGADGEITSTKYYTGADERTATYDINNDSGDKLIADTEKKLKEYIKPDTVELKMPDSLDLGIHIGSHIRVISDYLDSFTATVTDGVFKLDATGATTITWTAEI